MEIKTQVRKMDQRRKKQMKLTTPKSTIKSPSIFDDIIRKWILKERLEKWTQKNY